MSDQKTTYEMTQIYLRAPWNEGHLSRDLHYEGKHPAGERVLWRVYHNDPKYISVRLLDESGNAIVEFTEETKLVAELIPDEIKARVRDGFETAAKVAAFASWIGGGAGPCFVCGVQLEEGDDCPEDHFAGMES